MNSDEHFMQRAYELAQKAQAQDEVPVGAIIVLNNEIIAEGFNQPITTHDPTAHAEIIALRAAGNKTGNYRFPGATMYVTLEPCCMCAGALIHARIEKVIFAVSDPNTGALGSVLDLSNIPSFNHSIIIESGILKDRCRELIQSFFRAKRLSNEQSV
ncbi:MAG: tRNA adenosine(34) deaminase TadA [Pseudomonadota bacterium]